MILWAKIGISFVVGAAAAAFASPETAPRDVSAAYVDCEGCDPTGGIRVYTYRTAGTPPTPFWDQVGGTMTSWCPEIAPRPFRVELARRGGRLAPPA